MEMCKLFATCIVHCLLWLSSSCLDNLFIFIVSMFEYTTLGMADCLHSVNTLWVNKNVHYALVFIPLRKKQLCLSRKYCCST